MHHAFCNDGMGWCTTFVCTCMDAGGGMHHAFSNDGMGWCMFGDVHLAIRRLRAASHGGVKQVAVPCCAWLFMMGHCM